MSEPEVLDAQYKVVAACGVEATKGTEAAAKDAKQDHARFCDDCSLSDIEVAPIEDTTDSKARENGENQSEQNTDESTNGAKEATVVTESEPDEYTEQLPDDGPSVDEDPLVWMPDEFTDTIKGTTAINRKGFEVLAHHYDIECDTEHVVLPSETEYEYAVVKATAVDADGDTYGAYGEADISEEDMERPELLRYADTRAYKRAISRATGVGMVAVSELQAEGEP